MSVDASHRHLWEPVADGYACPECPATAPACITCRRPVPTGERVCEPCVSHARNDLRTVRDLYRQLPDVIASIAGLHAVRYDRGSSSVKRTAASTSIIGGDALVLAAGGNVSVHLGRYETSIDPSLLAAETHDPPSVLATVTWWEDTWRAERHDPAATTTSVDNAVDYLLTHTLWAATQSVTWGEYQQDLRNLQHRLRALTGETNRPVPENIPCVHCGGRVVRVWSDEGLTDVRECQRCGTSWPDVDRLRFTNHLRVLAAPVTDPDTLVTLDQARLALPDLKRNTLNQALKRDRDRAATDPAYAPRVPERGRNRRGEPLYRLGDITTITSNTSQEATA